MSGLVDYDVIGFDVNTHTGDLLRKIKKAAANGWRVVPVDLNGRLGGVLVEHDAPVPHDQRLDTADSKDK